MKLHLPQLLRKAVLACMTLVTGVTATVATGVFTGGVAAMTFTTAYADDAITYSGTIYTWNNTTKNADLAFGIYHVTTVDEQNSFDVSDADVLKGWDSSASTGTQAGLTVWGTIAPRSNVINGYHTIRLAADTYGQNIKDITFTFSDLSLGGIIVDQGATGYSIAFTTSSSSNRAIFLGNPEGGVAYSSINETFSIDNSGSTNESNTLTLRGTQVINIASGKTFGLKSSVKGINITGNVTVDGGGTLALNSASTITGSLTIDAGSTLAIHQAITNNGTLTLNGTIELSSSMESSELPTVNGFTGSTQYAFATGTAAVVGENAVWKVDGAVIQGTYANNTLVVFGESTIYGIVEAGTTVSTSSINGETGYLISGKDATLLIDEANALAGLTDGISLDVGSDNSGTVALSNGVAMNANAISVVSGSLNMTVGNGAELTLSDNTSNPTINGDLTVNAGGKVISTTGDTLGYWGGCTKNLNMIGAEGNLAVMDVAARVTMQTNIIMGGHAHINSTSAADAADPAAFDTFGGSIAATGTNNVIGINIREREALAIDVTNAADELEISGRIYRSVSGGDGGITKTGAGTLTLSYAGEDGNTLHGLLDVTDGTLVLAGNTTLNGGAKVASTATFKNEGTLTVDSFSALAMSGETTYTDINGTAATDGFRAGSFKLIEAESGASISGVESVIVNGVAQNTTTDAATGSILIQGIDLSTYWVLTNGHVYDSAKTGQATAISIQDGASLRLQSAASQFDTISLADTASLVIATGNSTTLAGAIGNAKISGNGSLTIDGNTTLSLSDGSLNNRKLVVETGSTLNASGCFLAADLTIRGTVNFTSGDAIDYNGSNTIMLEGGTMILNATRQSFNANHKLILDNATITGTGDAHGALDFFQNGAVVTSNGTSVIDAPIRLRTGGNSTTFDVQSGTLTISQVIKDAGNLIKAGEGEMILTAQNTYSGTTTINAGTLTVANGGKLGTGAKSIASGATLRVMHGAVMGGNTFTVNGGGTFEFAEVDNNLNAITLSLKNNSIIKMVLDANGESKNVVNVLELATDANRVLIDTGDTELELGKTYKLLSYSTLTNVTADKFALANTLLAGRYNTIFALDDTSKVLTLALATRDNALFWTGEGDGNLWNNETDNTPWAKADDTDTAYVANSVVNFESSVAEAERTVNIGAAIEAEAAYVQGTGWVWQGTGSISTTDALNVGGAEKTSLTIDMAGNKSFAGGVYVNADATLTLKNTANWTGLIQGEGTVELDINGTIDYGTIGSMIQLGEDALATLSIASGTVTEITASGQKTSIACIDTIVVQNGGQFANRLTDQTIGTGQKLHLAGAGTATYSETDYKAALSFGIECKDKNKTMTMNHEVTLMDDATIYVEDTQRGILGGTVTMDGHTLTKTGAGVLQLSGGAADATAAQSYDVQNGSIWLTTPKSQENISVKLAGGASMYLMVSAANLSHTFEQVTVENGATAVLGSFEAASCHAAGYAIKSLTGTGATLKLQSGARSSEATVFTLKDTTSTTFTGTLVLEGNVGGDKTGRNIGMNIEGDYTAAGSIITVAETTENRHIFGLGIATDSVTIAGLDANTATAGNLSLVSGAIAAKASAFASDGTARTLTINTAPDTAYSTNASVLADVNIKKTGTGTQSFVGDMSAFNGDIQVTEGKLIVGSAIQVDELTVTANGTAEFTEGLSISNKLSSSGTLTTGAISGNGAVSITGGTITLSDTTDAFANTGATSISGADLAGTWTADGINVGTGTIVSGTVTLNNSTIDGKLDSVSGTLNLGGTITVDKSGFTEGVDMNGTTTYSQGGYGFATAAYVVQLIKTPGNINELDGMNWVDKDGVGGTYDAQTGELTVKADTEGSRFYINGSSAVVYDATNAMFTNEKGEEATALVLNGGSLELTANLSESLLNSEGIVAEYTGESSVKLAQEVTVDKSFLHATADKTIALSGDGVYKIGATPSLGTGVSLGAGWTGTVVLDAQNLGGNDLALGTELFSSSGSTVKSGAVSARNLTATTGEQGQLWVDGDLALSGTASQVTGNLNVSGSTTLASATAAAALTVTGDMVSNGLVLGSDNQSATLTVNGSLVTQNITLAHAQSTIQAGSIICPSTLATTPAAGNLNILASDAVLNDLGVAASQAPVTIITLTGNDTATPTITVNGQDISSGLGDHGSKYFFTITWNDKLLQAVGTVNQNYVNEKVQTTDPNAAAGAQLLNDAFVNLDPQNTPSMTGGDLAALLNVVDDGNMTNERAASVAGSATAALGMAFSGDVERQLRAIRNRTTTMGVNQCVVNEGMPYFNAWVNAEGNMGELDQDGTMAGYTLDSWGGTIGFDVDVNPNLTLGLAITAMYGDFKVDGPDTLDGDLDTTYITAFARYSKRAWTHTFIATVGTMEGSYERTVNYGNGKYTTKGDTDGTGFGLMYEVGRTFALDRDGDAAAQLVANVAYRHTTVGGYTESGSDAALKVDDQTMDTVTLGVGGRVQAVVGENLFNRTSVLEARALAKFDMGDRSSEADVAFIGGKRSATVESAELGAFGVELGAGLSIPLGDEDSGTLFMDVSAELRSGYSNLNGTVGYRINF